MRPSALLVPALLLAAAPLAAQAPPPGCNGGEHRQFDFWIGTWQVRDAQGQVLGHNRISRILDGCALLEEWTGSSGSTGKSFNMYDVATRTWRQTWVDNHGGRLDLAGGMAGGRMVLEGERPGPDGAPLHHRISFEPRPDGTVHQRWEQSTDGRKTWDVVFDGFYGRKGGTLP